MLIDHQLTQEFNAGQMRAVFCYGQTVVMRRHEGIRARSDFFTCPPRLTNSNLDAIREGSKKAPVPFVGRKQLALIKMTMREKGDSISQASESIWSTSSQKLPDLPLSNAN